MDTFHPVLLLHCSAEANKPAMQRASGIEVQWLPSNPMAAEIRRKGSVIEHPDG
jgi:hypothetical protein